MLNEFIKSTLRGVPICGTPFLMERLASSRLPEIEDLNIWTKFHVLKYVRPTSHFKRVHFADDRKAEPESFFRFIYFQLSYLTY